MRSFSFVYQNPALIYFGLFALLSKNQYCN